MPASNASRAWSSCAVDSDGVDAAGGRDVLDDLRGLDRGLVERRPALGVDDRSAGGGDEVVEPDDVALVLLALLEDVALARRKLLRHRDHLVPRLRRGGDEVLAVPEQLHVGVQRDPVGLVLPLHGRLRAVEHVLERVLLLGALELAQPSGLRELRRPDRVHVDDVDVLVAGREAADDEFARRVGAVGHRRLLDHVLAAGLLAALLGGLRVRPARVERTEQVERDGASARPAAPRGDDGAVATARGGPHADAPTPHSAPLLTTSGSPPDV